MTNDQINLSTHSSDHETWGLIHLTPRTYHPHQLSSLTSLLDDLFKRYSKILVLRVDLNYREGIAEHTDFYRTAKKHLQRLLNRRRMNHHFKHVLGMAWKLEKALSWHYHTVWFFNGHHVHKDAYYGHFICKAWESLTQGLGYGYNCNGHARKYQSFTLGIIHRQDLHARARLLQTLSYLCKQDNTQMQAIPSAKFRTFGRTLIKDSPSKLQTLPKIEQQISKGAQ